MWPANMSVCGRRRYLHDSRCPAIRPPPHGPPPDPNDNGDRTVPVSLLWRFKHQASPEVQVPDVGVYYHTVIALKSHCQSSVVRSGSLRFIAGETAPRSHGEVNY